MDNVPGVHHSRGILYAGYTIHWDTRFPMTRVRQEFNPLVPELFCQRFDLLEIVSFLCTLLQHAVRCFKPTTDGSTFLGMS